MEKIAGFGCVADQYCRALVLGTAPSAMSIETGFYYAHPRNAFWRIAAQVFSAPLPETVEDKQALFLNNNIALWDVLKTCARKGSLDSAIRQPEPNDFEGFFERYPKVSRILFNGSAAQTLFMRLCAPALEGRTAVRLPSTSPANTQTYDEKLRLWRKELLA